VKLTVGETGRSSKVEHELKGFCANGNESSGFFQMRNEYRLEGKGRNVTLF
jgi:hypothetical protein